MTTRTKVVLAVVGVVIVLGASGALDDEGPPSTSTTTTTLPETTTTTLPETTTTQGETFDWEAATWLMDIIEGVEPTWDGTLCKDLGDMTGTLPPPGLDTEEQMNIRWRMVDVWDEHCQR